VFHCAMSPRAKAVIGGVLIGIVLLMAIVGVALPRDRALLLNFAIAGRGPNFAHPLGTDAMGRDVASRLLVGARSTLGTGLAATLIALGIGLLLGRLVEGTRLGRSVVKIFARVLFIAPSMLLSSRWWSRWVVALGCATLMLPAAFLALLAVAIAGPGFASSLIAVGVLFAIAPADGICRARGQTSRTTAASGRSLSLSLFAWAILVISTLDFLGLGAPPPTPSWGSLISQGGWSAGLSACCLLLALLGALLLADAFESYSKAAQGKGCA